MYISCRDEFQVLCTTNLWKDLELKLIIIIGTVAYAQGLYSACSWLVLHKILMLSPMIMRPLQRYTNVSSQMYMHIEMYHTHILYPHNINTCYILLIVLDQFF